MKYIMQCTKGNGEIHNAKWESNKNYQIRSERNQCGLPSTYATGGPELSLSEQCRTVQSLRHRPLDTHAGCHRLQGRTPAFYTWFLHSYSIFSLISFPSRRRDDTFNSSHTTPQRTLPENTRIHTNVAEKYWKEPQQNTPVSIVISLLLLKWCRWYQ